MFAIRDHDPSASIPYVTYGLILINVAVFLATWDYGPRQMQQLFLHYGLRPAQFFAGQGYSSLFTTMFLHAGFIHLAGICFICGFLVTTLRICWGIGAV